MCRRDLGIQLQEGTRISVTASGAQQLMQSGYELQVENEEHDILQGSVVKTPKKEEKFGDRISA